MYEEWVGILKYKYSRGQSSSIHSHQVETTRMSMDEWMNKM